LLQDEENHFFPNFLLVFIPIYWITSPIRVNATIIKQTGLGQIVVAKQDNQGRLIPSI